MDLNKNSQKSDQLVNLYRAAYYLGRGAVNVGLEFLRKSQNGHFQTIIDNPERYLTNSRSQLFWAEKILDQYQYEKTSKRLITTS